MNISCSQFEILMNFYLDNELTDKMKQAFETHLRTCKACREKYMTFKKIIVDLRETYQKITTYIPAVDSNTIDNSVDDYISAYIDNELDSNDNIKIKKMIISKADIREKVEKMNSLKMLLKNNFDKTTPKQDYSRKLLRKIFRQPNNNKEIICAIASFVILCIIWIGMLLASL